MLGFGWQVLRSVGRTGAVLSDPSGLWMTALRQARGRHAARVTTRPAQHTRDLLHQGFTHDELRRDVSRGRRSRLRRGSYLDEPDPAEIDAVHRHRLLVAATLPLCDPGSVLSHHSAAVVWGLPTAGLPSRVQLTRQPPHSGQDRGCVNLRVARLHPDEITEVDGLPVTTLARTVVDLARALRLEEAVVTGDAALAAGLDRDALDTVLALSRHRPGVIRARRACAFFDGRSESDGESVSRVRLAAAGLPAPELQHELRSPDGEFLGRVDFFWRKQRTVGEFDGRVKYGRLLRAGEHPGDVVFAEKRREDAIRRLGLEVVRWTWPDWERPRRVVGWVEDAFRRAAQRGRR
ncbi:putative transcriptional regulator of viral defense system [Friedmanniella endophytica]|uniref:Putative transcriptional regulator of viral defense system n=1 Tax=Microlunatus kandeliicorticis TaxID=1759536 RepID=A0A7W3ITY4_9ACTN|nr:hypothetical protein [Microlunatus kandeliicorticis]MBA8795153.1 putative transcriptional regulator of viral defense system [Microlunatus kandeliicorticis]